MYIYRAQLYARLHSIAPHSVFYAYNPCYWTHPLSAQLCLSLMMTTTMMWMWTTLYHHHYVHSVHKTERQKKILYKCIYMYLHVFILKQKSENRKNNKIKKKLYPSILFPIPHWLSGGIHKVNRVASGGSRRSFIRVIIPSVSIFISISRCVFLSGKLWVIKVISVISDTGGSFATLRRWTYIYIYIYVC